MISPIVLPPQPPSVSQEDKTLAPTDPDEPNAKSAMFQKRLRHPKCCKICSCNIAITVIFCLVVATGRSINRKRREHPEYGTVKVHYDFNSNNLWQQQQQYQQRQQQQLRHQIADTVKLTRGGISITTFAQMEKQGVRGDADNDTSDDGNDGGNNALGSKVATGVFHHKERRHTASMAATSHIAPPTFMPVIATSNGMLDHPHKEEEDSSSTDAIVARSTRLHFRDVVSHLRAIRMPRSVDATIDTINDKNEKLGDGSNGDENNQLGDEWGDDDEETQSNNPGENRMFIKSL